MVSSFITEHNPIGSTKQQQMMAWKTLNWNPAQERLDDFVYKLRRIGQELGITEDEQLNISSAVFHHICIYIIKMLLQLKKQWKTLKELVP